AVKGEGQHSQAMVKRTIVGPSKQEEREIEELYRHEFGETENLYLHEDEKLERLDQATLCVQKEEEGGKNKEKEE
ncbi:hypothetical protein Tco_1575017, partial [Tanacetum coccineum]